SGLRAILNFGHTIGHAIEAISGYGKFLHGEAISIGQVAAARLSTRLTGLPEKDAERIESLFRAAGLPTRMRINQRQFHRLFEAIWLGGGNERALPGESAGPFSADLPDDAGGELRVGRCAAVSGHVLSRK